MRNRFREAREERRMSAVVLAEKLQIHPSTLTNWEAGRRQITPDKLAELADILGFTVDYLLRRDSPQISLAGPIDKEALKVMHGQPIWTATHGWVLVNIVENVFVLKNFSLISFDEVSEPIYLMPPALSLGLRGAGNPLSIENILEMDRLWVEPITSDIDLAAELRGWYIMYEKRLAFRDCFEKRERL